MSGWGRRGVLDSCVDRELGRTRLDVDDLLLFCSVSSSSPLLFWLGNVFLPGCVSPSRSLARPHGRSVVLPSADHSARPLVASDPSPSFPPCPRTPYLKGPRNQNLPSHPKRALLQFSLSLARQRQPSRLLGSRSSSPLLSGSLFALSLAPLDF